MGIPTDALLTMMRAMTGVGNASQKANDAATKTSNTPADAAPANGAQLQALLGMAETEAKINHAIGAGHPSFGDVGIGRSIPQEAVGRCTLDGSPPLTMSAPLPPKSLDDDGNGKEHKFLSYLSLGIGRRA